MSSDYKESMKFKVWENKSRKKGGKYDLKKPTLFCTPLVSEFFEGHLFFVEIIHIVKIKAVWNLGIFPRYSLFFHFILYFTIAWLQNLFSKNYVILSKSQHQSEINPWK